VSLTISPSLTAAVREKSGGTAKHETITMLMSGDSALSKMAPKPIETRDGGKLSKDQIRRQKKSVLFFQRLQELRQTPGNCRRCGKPHADTTKKICAKCREHHNEYYRRKAAQIRNGESIGALAKRVASLEHELSRMLIDRRAVYVQGYQAGKTWKRKAQSAQSYLDAMPRITEQELATMNHAYDNEVAA